MTTRLATVERKIKALKAKICALGDMRPGSLSEQYNVCGKPDCRCKATPPLRHGPYHQVSFTFRRKSHSQFVRKQDLPIVRRQLRSYQRLRELLDLWIELAIEQSQLKLKEADPETTVSPRVGRAVSRSRAKSGTQHADSK